VSSRSSEVNFTKNYTLLYLYISHYEYELTFMEQRPKCLHLALIHALRQSCNWSITWLTNTQEERPFIQDNPDNHSETSTQYSVRKKERIIKIGQYLPKVKEKFWTLAIAPFTWVGLVTSSSVQSRKWQLIGMRKWCRSALCGHPLPALTDNSTHGAASRHTIAPISHTRPSPHSHNYYSFPVPLRAEGWSSWPEHTVG